MVTHVGSISWVGEGKPAGLHLFQRMTPRVYSLDSFDDQCVQ